MFQLRREREAYVARQNIDSAAQKLLDDNAVRDELSRLDIGEIRETFEKYYIENGTFVGCVWNTAEVDETCKYGKLPDGVRLTGGVGEEGCRFAITSDYVKIGGPNLLQKRDEYVKKERELTERETLIVAEKLATMLKDLDISACRQGHVLDFVQNGKFTQTCSECLCMVQPARDIDIKLLEKQFVGHNLKLSVFQQGIYVVVRVNVSNFEIKV